MADVKINIVTKSDNRALEETRAKLGQLDKQAGKSGETLGGTFYKEGNKEIGRAHV